MELLKNQSLFINNLLENNFRWTPFRNQKNGLNKNQHLFIPIVMVKMSVEW